MTEDKAKEKELQQKYMEFQMMTEQIKQVQTQLEKMQGQIEDLENVQESLETLGDTPAESEMLVPLSNGIFAKAKLDKMDQLLVNVGSGVVVEKSLEDTKKLLKSQSVEINQYKEQMSNQMELMLTQIQLLERELKGMVS